MQNVEKQVGYIEKEDVYLRSKAQYFFYSLFLRHKFMHCPECSKTPIFAPKPRFLTEETDGFLSFPIWKPMVSKPETIGFFLGNPRKPPYLLRLFIYCW